MSQARIPHVLFRRDYMEYHADRFADASLVVLEGFDLIAALPASREGTVVSSHGGLTFGGFISDARMTARRMLEVFDATLETFRDAGANKLLYAPPPHIYHLTPAEEDLYALYRNGARLNRRDVSATVRMGAGITATKGRRSGARRAERLGVVCMPSDEWASFMQLEADVLRTRHGTSPTHSAAEIQRLAALFPDAIKLYCAFAQDELVAGTIVYESPSVAHTQYIGVNERGRELDAGAALITYLLEDVYREKRYFDFGISTIDGGLVLNEGLARSKESYGARSVVYDRYEVDL